MRLICTLSNFPVLSHSTVLLYCVILKARDIETINWSIF
jgi:hypothetical protein